MIAKEQTSTIQNDQEVFDLVRGEFTASDAAEILDHLIQQKINFHLKRNLSSQLRFGADDDISLERLEQLRESRKRLEAMISEATEKGMRVRVLTQIKVEPISEIN